MKQTGSINSNQNGSWNLKTNIKISIQSDLLNGHINSEEIHSEVNWDNFGEDIPSIDKLTNACPNFVSIRSYMRMLYNEVNKFNQSLNKLKEVK